MAAARDALAGADARTLFPNAPHPEAALAGLYLYYSCFDECHGVAQDLATPEGSYWHGILHRQEPDAANAGYWFRRVGRHAVFESLNAAANEIASRNAGARFATGAQWDPFAFIDYCERARELPGSVEERTAREIQRAEWELLFDYCARPRA